MPIYEFYCDSCSVIFNFYSSRINTTSQPACPKCGQEKLNRQISTFATLRATGSEDDNEFAGLDETRMEHAFESLMKEASSVNEDDPRQMASLMRKFSAQTGLILGDTMEEAISRMEAGEDPDQVEKEMGDVFADDDFSLAAMQKKVKAARVRPIHDEKLYTLS